MRLLVFIIAICLLNSCKSEVSEQKDPPVRNELSQDSKIFLGNRLFSEKTCITCHALDSHFKAPSVVEIMNVYKQHDADIVAFLKGNSEPIVDTTSSEVAIMQANIDGFLKEITEVELDAIATYMLHVDQLQKQLE